MMADDRNRCRWCEDGAAGRCLNVQAFPGMGDVPPFCMHHLAALEPWVAARASGRGAEAPQWIAWAKHKADGVQSVRRLLGDPAGVA